MDILGPRHTLGQRNALHMWKHSPDNRLYFNVKITLLQSKTLSHQSTVKPLHFSMTPLHCGNTEYSDSRSCWESPYAVRPLLPPLPPSKDNCKRHSSAGQKRVLADIVDKEGRKIWTPTCDGTPTCTSLLRIITSFSVKVEFNFKPVGKN